MTDQISLMGLDHVFVCTAVEGKIYFRHYSINLKKSGTNVPSHPPARLNCPRRVACLQSLMQL